MAVMAEAGTQQYEQELTPDPQHLGRIRRIVAAFARYWGWPELAAPVALCVTELLSNVSRHTSGRCVLLLQSTPTALRIAVSDDSPDFPVVRAPQWSSETGRGMFLLSTTADAWGADPTPTGKEVWVEFHTRSETVPVPAPSSSRSR
jgi:anti-sigma regulatory factor (Ser/Thr protein kinase)